MISFPSFLRFSFSNIFLLSLGTYEYFHYDYNLNNSIFYQFICLYAIAIFRNMLLFSIIDTVTDKYKYINDKSRTIPHEKYENEFIFNFLRLIFIETSGVFFLPYVFSFSPTESYNLFYLLSQEWCPFLFKSFFLEIIFDLFHYLNHRVLHEIPFLYKNIHKYHHSHPNPNLWSIYQHNSFDFLFTNTLPLYISLYIGLHFFSFSILQLKMLIIMKIAVEFFGHCGKDIYKTGSFFQCIWLPKIFGIELYVKDHDLHHSKNNCNYSKRFSLWDKIFETLYIEKEEI